MTLKLLGLGLIGYIRDGFNIFDRTLVIMSFLEMWLAEIHFKGVIVLRAFRLLRMFKLAKSWKGLREIIETVMKSLGSIGY